MRHVFELPSNTSAMFSTIFYPQQYVKEKAFQFSLYEELKSRGRGDIISVKISFKHGLRIRFFLDGRIQVNFFIWKEKSQRLILLGWIRVGFSR